MGTGVGGVGTIAFWLLGSCCTDAGSDRSLFRFALFCRGKRSMNCSISRWIRWGMGAWLCVSLLRMLSSYLHKTRLTRPPSLSRPHPISLPMHTQTPLLPHPTNILKQGITYQATSQPTKSAVRISGVQHLSLLALLVSLGDVFCTVYMTPIENLLILYPNHRLARTPAHLQLNMLPR